MDATTEEKARLAHIKRFAYFYALRDLSEHAAAEKDRAMALAPELKRLAWARASAPGRVVST
jgi:hypothetical protein